MEKIEILKCLYIIVIAVFYINLLVIAYFEKVKSIKPIISFVIINALLLVDRENIFDCIKDYYENEMYRNIGISSIDILVPLITISIGGVYFIIRIVLENKKYRKNDMRKFKILVTDYDDFKVKLNELNKKGVNSTYEILENKNARKNNKKAIVMLNTEVTFFNLPYDEACIYAQQLDSLHYESENGFIGYFSVLVVIAILDFSLVYFRFTNDNYTTILELIKMTLA